MKTADELFDGSDAHLLSEFEKWWNDQDHGAPAQVFNSDEDMAKAAYRQALLDAVKTVDAHRIDFPCDRWQSAYDSAVAEVSAAIRKMAEEE